MASAIGVSVKDPPPGKERETARANVKYVLAKEEAYLPNMPVLPSAPVAPPSDTPGELAHDVFCALDFGRKTGSLALATCALCRETRINDAYFGEVEER